MLSECDRLRDETLIDMGVWLVDQGAKAPLVDVVGVSEARDRRRMLLQSQQQKHKPSPSQPSAVPFKSTELSRARVRLGSKQLGLSDRLNGPTIDASLLGVVPPAEFWTQPALTGYFSKFNSKV